MRNKKTGNSDKIIDLAKKQIDTSIENLANLETSIQEIQQELLNIQRQKLASEKRTKDAEEKLKNALSCSNSEKDSEKDSQKELHINGQKFLVLPNLSRKNEEALSDAIAFFEKKCPYCDTNLFDGHFRNKIEIDHYIPVAKGGQDVPWNILPVCKKCNRRKRDHAPEAFLEPARLQYCENYLHKVRERLVDEIQICIEQHQQIKNYLMTCQKQNPSFKDIRELQNVLVNIFKILNIEFISPVENPGTTAEQMLDKIRTYHVRINTGNGLINTTVGELITMINRGRQYPEDPCSTKDAHRELAQLGIKVADGFAYIANNSDAMRKVFENSPWASEWGRPLRDIYKTEITPTIYFSPGIKCRATRLPIDIL